MPRVSVIMPFHRVTPFLVPAVRSILHQTFADLELLLVDNGTGVALDDLGSAGRDPRVRMLRLPTNLGVAAAHNAAQAQARGEFIANMDSDDLAHPRRLARQVEALAAEPGLGLLATHALVIDAADRVVGQQFTLASAEEQRVFSAYSLPVTNPSLMGRREVFARHPMRGEFHIASDYDFFARAVEEHRSGCLPEALLSYRQHAGQATQSEGPEMVFNACLIRLVTARRRSGHPEQVPALLAGVGPWRQRAPAPADAYAEFARRASAEGHPLLAVFCARRALAARPKPGMGALACRILAGALIRSPRQAPLLFRMFATGPLRAHGLKPFLQDAAARAAD